MVHSFCEKFEISNVKFDESSNAKSYFKKK